jgi:hypothetical protein
MGAVGLIYTNSSANQLISFRGVCQKAKKQCSISGYRRLQTLWSGALAKRLWPSGERLV